MKVSENFIIQEFVPNDVHQKFGDKSIWFVDKKLIKLMQEIRNYFDKSITINDWHTGGKFNYRGFRDDSFYKNNQKGLFSQHRFGRAVDFNISGVECEEVRYEILKNEQQWLEMGLTTLESGVYSPTWVHLDIRPTNEKKILIVTP